MAWAREQVAVSPFLGRLECVCVGVPEVPDGVACLPSCSAVFAEETQLDRLPDDGIIEAGGRFTKRMAVGQVVSFAQLLCLCLLLSRTTRSDL